MFATNIITGATLNLNKKAIELGEKILSVVLSFCNFQIQSDHRLRASKSNRTASVGSGGNVKQG